MAHTDHASAMQMHMPGICGGPRSAMLTKTKDTNLLPSEIGAAKAVGRRRGKSTVSVSPIVQALIEQRKRQRLTQVALCARMRRQCPKMLSNWECGRIDPSLRSLENWCHALGVTLATLPVKEAA